jgi:signal transduction histidine kinase
MVRLVLRTSDNSVNLRIDDDGAGFAFKGIYELPDLLALGVGAQTLARLVAIFGGRMRLDSGATGSRIEIALPRDGAGRDIPAPPLPRLAIAG